MTAPCREGDPCGLYIDLAPDEPAPRDGDWIATEAGARYLVTSARLVRSRRHAQRKRWNMRVVRLAYGADVPDDVRCIWLRWYSRGRR